MPREIWDIQKGMFLEEHERLIFPEMYRRNRHLYDKIRGVVYLVRSRSHPEHIDWIWDSSYGRTGGDDLEIIDKLLFVELRLPWDKLEGSQLVDVKEYHDNRDYYELVDLRFLVTRRENPVGVEVIEASELELHRDEYDILDVRYYVTKRLTPEARKRFLGIDRNHFDVVMSE